MASTTTAQETFSTREIAEGVAHDLVCQAEEAVEAARAYPATDPMRIALMNAAARALAAAGPFVPSAKVARGRHLAAA